MRPNPDNRKDNVEKIQNNIDHTIKKMELAKELIEKTDNDKNRKDLEEKNHRREDALKGMKEEIKDESLDREQGYHS